MDFFAAGGFQQLFNELQQPHNTNDDDELSFSLSLNPVVYEQPENEFYLNFSEPANLAAPVTQTETETEIIPTNNEPGEGCYLADVSFCNSNASVSSASSHESHHDHNGSQQMLLGGSQLLLDGYDYYSARATTTTTNIRDCNNNALQYISTGLLLENDAYNFSQQDFTDWENRFLDNFVEIPELTELLPEKTPLCTDMCDHFLQESSDNLKLLAINESATLSPMASNEPTTTPPLSPNPTTTTITTETRLELTDKGYPCTYGSCQKIYAKPAHLKAHLRRHLGEKPYICKWPGCNWKFSRSDELARHGRSHSGIKPYKCDYCGKCFARSDHLTKHRKVHERRLLAASRAGKLLDTMLTQSIYTVRPGRKRKNQIC